MSSTRAAFSCFAEEARQDGRYMLAVLLQTMADVFDTEREDDAVERYEDTYQERLEELWRLAEDLTERDILGRAVARLHRGYSNDADYSNGRRDDSK